jgi:GNAT superfamily N-acetyltransferase
MFLWDRLVLEWVPPFWGWRRDHLYRGDGEGFLVHGEKRGKGIGKLLERFF